MSIVAHRAIGSPPTSQLGPVGWIAGGELGYQEWLQQGSRLGLAGRNAAWWIGDWVRYGASRYGTKYSAAERVTGYDRQTLMNMVYVAARFEISRRRENLSWSHHAEVAALDAPEQDRWLNRAVVERLSVRDLREELASRKRATGRAGARPAMTRAAEREVTCPHCGHSFVA
ncbi:MAG: hypothetical protein ACYCXW_03765 [Solirubrobacteraceae bacterium]